MKKTSTYLGMFVSAILFVTPAFAQDDNTSGSNTSRTTEVRTEERDDDTDYSWLGLLGLAGLAGLLKKPERQVVHHNTETVHTPNVGTGPGTHR